MSERTRGLSSRSASEREGRVVLGPFSVDRVQALSDLAVLGELDVEVACFGHGEPVCTGAAEAVARATDPFA